MYDGYHFLGMHLFWWFGWGIFIFWIFALPYEIPGQRRKKDTALDILEKRFIDGKIHADEYREKRRVLLQDKV